LLFGLLSHKIGTNSWTTFDIPKSKISQKTRNLTVYNNFLLSSGFDEDDKSFLVSILNLEDIGGLETPEQRCIRKLFMNKEGSDIIFKIQDQTIPAHKEILIQKSKYFNNLFNSNEIL